VAQENRNSAESNSSSEEWIVFFKGTEVGYGFNVLLKCTMYET
jgi:hypothetical protein